MKLLIGLSHYVIMAPFFLAFSYYAQNKLPYSFLLVICLLTGAVIVASQFVYDYLEDYS